MVAPKMCLSNLTLFGKKIFVDVIQIRIGDEVILG